jgi:hypothetical protein
MKKINSITATAMVAAAVQFMTLDHLYFENSAIDLQQQIVTPNQYGNTINYVSVKSGKKFEILLWIIPVSKVSQQDAILNVPELVTRNTIYYTNYLFKKHCFTNWNNLNYFTKYFANDYNPVIGSSLFRIRKKLETILTLTFYQCAHSKN